MAPDPRLVARALSRGRARAEITFAALPSMVEEYARICERAAADLAREVTPEQSRELRDALARAVDAARAVSPHGEVVVRAETDNLRGVRWEVAPSHRSLEETYDAWSAEKPDAACFGKHPDAKVMEVARSLGSGAACLDVGAGDGRNALPLARAGLEVDAIEPAPFLADALVRLAEREGARLRVIRASALDRSIGLDEGRYALVVASEVTPHLRDARELRLLLEIVAASLAPGGVVVLNAFLADEGLEPDALTRELSTVVWSTLFTRAELSRAIEGLGLALVSDEGVADYERLRAPSWPPTRWFESWARGHDLFPRDAPSGAELRWIVLRKR